MENVYLDDFKLHDLSDTACKFFIMPPIKGLDFSDLRVSSHNKAGADGIAISSIYLGERRVFMTGKIADVTQAEHLSYRRSFLANLAPIRTGGILQTRTLRFTDLDGTAYRLLVQVVSADMPRDQVSHSTWTLDLLAVGGYIEAYDASSQNIATLTRGGFILPVVLPIVFEAGSGGSATLANNGDATAYPIITLTGALTNPRILNNTTGEFIALTLTIATGEEVVIDMAEHTVVQGGVTNRLSAVSEDSTFFGLEPGNTNLQLTTSVTGEAGTATVEWRHAYYGV